MALDKSIQRKIDGVVREWTNAGKMFTAFEVSLEVKGQGVRERHRNMRDYVHQSLARIAGENYTRTLRDVGAPVQAWVYHRLRDNPYAYVPLDRTGMDPSPGATGRQASGRGQTSASVPTAMRNPRPLSAHTGAPATVDDGAYGTDNEGRLIIPAEMVTRLGVAVGETAEAECDADNEELRLMRPSSLRTREPDAKYMVEADGKIRLTQADLDRAGLGALQAYHVVSRGNLITVREFKQ